MDVDEQIIEEIQYDNVIKNLGKRNVGISIYSCHTCPSRDRFLTAGFKNCEMR